MSRLKRLFCSHIFVTGWIIGGSHHMHCNKCGETRQVSQLYYEYKEAEQSWSRR